MPDLMLKTKARFSLYIIGGRPSLHGKPTVADCQQQGESNSICIFWMHHVRKGDLAVRAHAGCSLCTCRVGSCTPIEAKAQKHCANSGVLPARHLVQSQDQAHGILLAKSKCFAKVAADCIL